jgi:hypothetical protein
MTPTLEVDIRDPASVGLRQARVHVSLGFCGFLTSKADDANIQHLTRKEKGVKSFRCIPSRVCRVELRIKVQESRKAAGLPGDDVSRGRPTISIALNWTERS